jgi:hypothetical protein
MRCALPTLTFLSVVVAAAAPSRAHAEEADLRLQIFGPSATSAGGFFEHDVFLVNDGPDIARGVTLTIEPPEGIELESVVVCDLFFVCVPRDVREVDGVITVAPGDLDPRGISLVFVGMWAPQELGPLTTSATASSETYDPDVTNNNPSLTTTVSLPADLAVTAEVTNTSRNATTITIHVTNLGPGDATGVGVNEYVPGATIESMTPSAGECFLYRIPEGGFCALGGLAVGGSATVVVTLAPGSGGGPMLSHTSVYAAELDPDWQNNSAFVALQYPGASTRHLVEPWWISEAVYAECAEELIVIEGTAIRQYTELMTPSGLLRFQAVEIPRDLTAYGIPSGETFRVQRMLRYGAGFREGSFVDTIIVRLELVGESTGRHISMTVRIHNTVTPDGTPVRTFEVQSVDCRGT